MHCDTLLKLMWKPETGLRENDFCVDIKKMKKGESLAQFFACFIPMRRFQGENVWGQGYEYALQMIARGKKEFLDNRDAIALAQNYEDIMKNKAEGKMSAFLTIEEGGILDNDMNRLERLYEEGIRLITLTWNYENCLGYPNDQDEELMQKGLKPFGIEVVERMNELGMIVDVSHLSDGGFWDVIRHSKKPVVASHSNARSMLYHPRNLLDDMIHAIAETGGIGGLNFYPAFVNESSNITAEYLADHVEYMFQTGGEDFVAIGTDFDGFDDGRSTITNLGQMNEVYEVIKRRGFTESQMEKFWSGNALRVIRETL